MLLHISDDSQSHAPQGFDSMSEQTFCRYPGTKLYALIVAIDGGLYGAGLHDHGYIIVMAVDSGSSRILMYDGRLFDSSLRTLLHWSKGGAGCRIVCWWFCTPGYDGGDMVAVTSRARQQRHR